MNAPDSHSTPPTRTRVLAAFLVIYVVWGSTYLGIKIAIETIPPLLMAGARFVIAGGLLFAVLWLRGERMGSGVHWRHAAVVGVALLAGGNGGVTWAERTIPSGIAALVIGSAPLWFALVEWLRPGGSRPRPRTWLGIAIGFVGIAALTAPTVGVDHIDSLGVAVLLGSCVSWAAGSIYSKHTPKPASPGLTIAAQMILGGLALLAASAMAGEVRVFDPRHVSLRSEVAFVYLIIAGSWIGFSVYIWLLRVCKPTSVASYAYVNPVVAVFLGWAVLGEPVTPRIFWAAAIVIAGVIVLTMPASITATARPWVPAGWRRRA